jgi:hypothetical protein
MNNIVLCLVLLLLGGGGFIGGFAIFVLKRIERKN